MKTIELARKLAGYDQVEDAQKAYRIAIGQGGLSPEEELEAAVYLFHSQDDYKIPYTSFISLFNRGYFQAEVLEIMSQAFYLPNVQTMQRRYEENCRLLKNYPYLFRKDFLPFEELPIWFFPFDDRGYVPYDLETSHFGSFVDFSDPVIDRYFFKDLEKPILAEDVYSQYHLEYLNDTVRKSEWVGRENHIYLHYTSWPVFCAHLQCLDLRKLLKDKKFVFLIEEERALYPLDFQERFGIDYGKYPVKPVGVREITRLIWHTQLATHNGGDFFNEIFYGHPNLLAIDSVMMDNLRDVIQLYKKDWKKTGGKGWESDFYRLISSVKNPTDKDFFVGLFLSDARSNRFYDRNARIAPALFFQPHFSNMEYEVRTSEKNGESILTSAQYEQIKNAPIFHQFKYIKTFTPMRRITTSYAASTRYVSVTTSLDEETNSVANDMLTTRLLNRSFMIDPEDRLYHDSVLVRFEDGKLNPTATFTALAEFLDLPYTESMTYCSSDGVENNAPAVVGNIGGFDSTSVYRTYDDYADDDDRALLEYFMRDAYAHYGYDFHYYKGEPVDKTWIEKKCSGAVKLDQLIVETHRKVFIRQIKQQLLAQNVDLSLPENKKSMDEYVDLQVQLLINGYHGNRIRVAETLQKGLHFVNQREQPLQLMKKLELDPALLEQPLYH